MACSSSLIHTQNVVDRAQLRAVDVGDAYSLISIYVRHHPHLLVLYVLEEFLVDFDSLTSAFRGLVFDTCEKVE